MSENVDDTIHLGGAGPSGVKQRRPRLRLNCSECRGKKLSCDRKLPCQRCVRAGKPDLCTYEAFPPGTRPSAGARYSAGLNDGDFGAPLSQQNDDQIRELQAEIAQLKEHLFQTSISQSNPDSYGNGDIESLPTLARVASDSGSEGQATVTSPVISPHSLVFNQRPTRTYQGSSTLIQLFYDIPQLPSYLQILSEEHLKPRGIHLGRTYYPADAPNSNIGVARLVALLPLKEDTDALVSFYLNHAEHIHRIVHVPTFEQEYVNFWLQEPQLRHPAMAALILSMISIAIATSNLFPDNSPYRPMAPHWISASARWLSGEWRSQPSRPRNLVYYQISCLVYLAKRVNWVRQNPFWTDTARLIQTAIMDGLHLDPPGSDTPYMREMKRRIWATLRELDLQTSFDYGLPTVLHTLDSTISAPSNINDSEFSPASTTIPASRPPRNYTQTSYQSSSARSFDLRVEISKQLFAGGRGRTNPQTPYTQVLQYTHQLTQALDSLPGWTIEAGVPNDADCGGPRKVTLMVWALLQYQLKECLILLHRQFVHPILISPPTSVESPSTSRYYSQSFPSSENSSSSLSETILYQNALSILVLTRKLAVLGSQCLISMRNDLTLACLALCLVTLSRPKGSLSIPIINSNQTVGLLEDMLPFFEASFLRSSHIHPLPFVHPGLSHTSVGDGADVVGSLNSNNTGAAGPGTLQSRIAAGLPTTNTPAAWRTLMIYAVLVVTKIHVGKDDEARAHPCCANRFSRFWSSHIDRQVEHQYQHNQQQHHQNGMMTMIGGGDDTGYEVGSTNMWQHTNTSTRSYSHDGHLREGPQSPTMNEYDTGTSNGWNFEIGGQHMSDPFSFEIEQAGW